MTEYRFQDRLTKPSDPLPCMSIIPPRPKALSISTIKHGSGSIIFSVMEMPSEVYFFRPKPLLIQQNGG